MNKTIFKYALVFIMMMLCVTVFAGGKKEQAPSPQPQVQAAPVPTEPSWAYDQPDEGANVFWGVGYIKLQNDSLAQRTATALARRDVAAQLETMVQGMLTDYAREAGKLNDAVSVLFIEDVGRALINHTLSGAAVNARERMSDNTWWIRVSLPKPDAKDVITNVVTNEASRYAEFSAAEALRRLDFELERTRSRPDPRTE